jgi:hypothetical protein
MEEVDDFDDNPALAAILAASEGSSDRTPKDPSRLTV